MGVESLDFVALFASSSVFRVLVVLEEFLMFGREDGDGEGFFFGVSKAGFFKGAGGAEVGVEAVDGAFAVVAFVGYDAFADG